MSTLVLDTVSVKTDAFSGLSSSSVGYSTTTLQWVNVSESQSDFRIVDESGNSMGSTVTVEGGATGSFVATSLSPGSSTKFYLERYEVDTWIGQTSTSSLDYVLSSTASTSMTTSVGSSSANITWATPVSGSSYKFMYGVEDGQPISLTTSEGEVSLTDLVQGQQYETMVLVTENGEDVELDRSSFTTSSAAQMTITGPYASYVGIDWSNSVDDAGSLYRIVNRVDSSDDVLAESSSETTAVIKDLTPGETYNFVLQRQELSSTWSDQSEAIINTLSTSLSVSSVASKTIELSWASLYDGAQFEVFYTESGGSPVGNGRITDLTNIIRSLSAGTDYSMELVVYELEETVGLSSLGLTTNDDSSSMKTMGIVALVIVLIAFIVMKNRS